MAGMRRRYPGSLLEACQSRFSETARRRAGYRREGGAHRRAGGRGSQPVFCPGRLSGLRLAKAASPRRRGSIIREKGSGCHRRLRTRPRRQAKSSLPRMSATTCRSRNCCAAAPPEYASAITWILSSDRRRRSIRMRCSRSWLIFSDGFRQSAPGEIVQEVFRYRARARLAAVHVAADAADGAADRARQQGAGLL